MNDSKKIVFTVCVTLACSNLAAQTNTLPPIGIPASRINQEYSQGSNRSSKGEAIANKAFALYEKGKVDEASTRFEEAYHATGDSHFEYLYNAAFSAQVSNNLPRAKSLYEQCIGNQYYAMGEVYAKLAEIAEQENNLPLSRNYLETGVSLFPNNQAVLIGLINSRINSGADPSETFSLLERAKNNEPNNASLFYVEGNLLSKLGRTEEASLNYDKCAVVDPTYLYGHIGKGIMYYNLAVEIQGKIQTETDDYKTLQLADQFEKALMECISPFEKAFELSNDASLKKSIAEYLVNSTGRFAEDSLYKAKYEKYSRYLSGQ